MNVFKMRDLIKSRLAHLDVQFKYNREQETLRVSRVDNDKGVTIKLTTIVAKYKSQEMRIVDEIVYYIEETITQMENEQDKQIEQVKIYPVIRASSFDKKTREGQAFITDTHTAETTIYYALDMGKSYRLLDEKLMQELKLSKSQVQSQARFNVRALTHVYKTDEVKGNFFYFINTNDGYDASRILNTQLLESFEQQCEGEMLVAVPHQDVLIIADIRNQTGYDVIAHLTMEFFTKGLVPITSLSFSYQKGHLEPVFILAKNNKAPANTEVKQTLKAVRTENKKDD